MSMKTRGFAGVIAIMAFVTVGAAQTKTAAPAQSKDQAPKAETWAGKISDAHCGAAKHTMGKSDAECVAGCVKGGETYVFVGPKDKVFKIGNQKFADLAKFAGQSVEVTGTAKDDTITVTKIAAPKAK